MSTGSAFEVMYVSNKIKITVDLQLFRTVITDLDNSKNILQYIYSCEQREKVNEKGSGCKDPNAPQNYVVCTFPTFFKVYFRL